MAFGEAHYESQGLLLKFIKNEKMRGREGRGGGDGESARQAVMGMGCGQGGLILSIRSRLSNAVPQSEQDRRPRLYAGDFFFFLSHL